MSTPPAESDPGTPDADAWGKLFALNQMLVKRAMPTPEDESGDWLSQLASGAPPRVPALSTEIDNAKEHFNIFTSQATGFETSNGRGEAFTDEQVGSLLDKARAWVEYFGPAGPLCRGFPPSTAPQVYVDALARVGQLQRVAQQWVDYFQPLWEKGSSAQQERARDDEECLRRVSQAEETVRQRQMSFALNSSSLSSQQMQGYIQELNDLLATVQGWATTTAGGACTERIQGLTERIVGLRATFDFSFRSRASFEDFQRGQGWLPPSGVGMASGRPGPGSPEWYQGITGMNCYWCGWSLDALPKPVGICPNCGRYPEPHS